MCQSVEICSIWLIGLFLLVCLFLERTCSVTDRQRIDVELPYYLEEPISRCDCENCSGELHMGHISGLTRSPVFPLQFECGCYFKQR